MNLLIDEYPLLVLPTLARVIGLNEAIVLQQVHYWMGNKKVGVVHDGKKWIKNSYEEWRENFPFWSIRTIQRTFESLEERGLLLASRIDAGRYDQTKYYTINYDAVRQIERQIGILEDDKLASSEDAKLASSLNESETTETTTKPDPVPRKANIPSASLEWLIAVGASAEEIQAAAQGEREAADVCAKWEQEMNYNPLNWEKRDMVALKRHLLSVPLEEISRFAAWSKRPYSTFDPAKAALNPRMVIELWPLAMQWNAQAGGQDKQNGGSKLMFINSDSEEEK